LITEPHSETKILGAIHGGKNISLLSRSLEQILDFEVDGFTICDICDKETIEERELIYNTIHQRLGEIKDKKFILAMAGLGKIEDIVHAMKFGVTIFEINYPFALAEEQKALIHNEDGTYS
jgi:tRNA-guanine family transglycosylase